MNESVTLTITSLLSILFTTFHLTGSGGVTGGIKSGGAFFFAWTLIALGVTAIFSVILSALGLRSLQRSQPRSAGANK